MTGKFQWCLTSIILFKNSVKYVSRKFRKKQQGCFQECFNGVLLCNFVVAWISLQLPEQKEGLFFPGNGFLATECKLPQSTMFCGVCALVFRLTCKIVNFCLAKMGQNDARGPLVLSGVV